jgi:hypothetical protein
VDACPDQDHCAIFGTVTVAFGGFDQLLDIALGWMPVRTLRGRDCPYFFGWRYQPELWFPRGFRLSTQ